MTIPARLSIVTLGVADLTASIAFYESLGWTRSPASSDAIAWFGTSGSAIGLFPRDELAADAAVPSGGHGFDGVTLAINVGSEAEVDAALESAREAGAGIPKPGERAEWGGYSGYFADPDGHLWEVAYNPEFLPGPDGTIDVG